MQKIFMNACNNVLFAYNRYFTCLEVVNLQQNLYSKAYIALQLQTSLHNFMFSRTTFLMKPPSVQITC